MDQVSNSSVINNIIMNGMRMVSFNLEQLCQKNWWFVGMKRSTLCILKLGVRMTPLQLVLIERCHHLINDRIWMENMAWWIRVLMQHQFISFTAVQLNHHHCSWCGPWVCRHVSGCWGKRAWCHPPICICWIRKVSQHLKRFFVHYGY